MCGICGIISFKEPINSASVKRMNASLVHRGPDGEGYFFDTHVGLGMRRLSIIDLQGGWQPLYNEDKSIVLVLNGEIYNYIELQATLVKKGHRLSSKSDSETVIHLYEESGIECLKHLRGMFAFILYDIKKQQVFIVRDRVGEKPIYISKNNKKLVFCSELRTLYASRLVDTTINYKAIDKFFHYHYIPEPETPFNEINKLEGGHYLQIDCRTNTISDHCYWEMTEAPALTGNPADLIREQLDDVSKIVIRSDVPVGIALSGGLDSSIVASLAMKYYGSKMNAFCIGYEGIPESDERQDARKFADYLGMPFHEIELKTNDFIEFFPTLTGLSDDPIADISAFGYYSVSKKAQEAGVPVLLQGQGGDELFWGYPWTRDALKQAHLKSLMHKYPPIIAFWFYVKLYFPKIKYKAFRHWVKQVGGLVPSIKMFLLHRQFPVHQLPFYENISKSSVKQIRLLYSNTLAEAVANQNPYQFAERPLPWVKPEIMLTEIVTKSYLLENGIAQGDRLSMANSVELRLPLVDYKLIETVIGLRKNYNDSSEAPKYWLKEATKDFIPEWVMNRRKRGFEPPIQEWIDGILKSYGENLINGKLIEEGILTKEAARLLSENPKLPAMVFPQSFNALILEYWFKSLREP
jgi:asparagine synthase (glutamine-hydrolysing)